MIATVTSKGQVTLPAPLREKLGIRAGSKLDFSVQANGHIEIEVINGTLKDLKGILSKPSRALTLEEMEAALTGE
jgi:antitoxin PrlF